jgi:hypothetical protein
MMMKPAVDNFWLVYQSYLTVLTAETFGASSRSGRRNENFVIQYLWYVNGFLHAVKSYDVRPSCFTSHPKEGVLGTVSGKLTITFSRTPSSGTTIHTRFVQNRLLISIPNHNYAHNNNQYLTRRRTRLHRSVNNFRGSRCKCLTVRYAAPAGRREVIVLGYYTKRTLYWSASYRKGFWWSELDSSGSG